MQRLNLELERSTDSNRRSQLGNHALLIESGLTKAHRARNDHLGRCMGA